MTQDSSALHRTCFDAIKLCEQAELKAQQACEAAERTREASLSAAKARSQAAREAANKTRAGSLASAQAWSADIRQQAEKVLRSANTLMAEGDKIIQQLQLTRLSAQPFQPPSGAGTDELRGLLRSYHDMLQDSLAKLKVSAERLKVERRKWWQFW